MRRNRKIPLGILATLIATTIAFLLSVCPAVQASDSIQATHRVGLDEVRQVINSELSPRTTSEEQPLSVDDIEVPLAVPMRPGSILRVSSMCWDQNAQSMRFQLRCGRTSECLPFLAYVRGTLRANVPACQAESVHAARKSAQSQVRTGAHATAVLSGAGIRINAEVTCLQGGNPGDIIRVRGHEGRVFRARIIGPSLVEASIE